VYKWLIPGGVSHRVSLFRGDDRVCEGSISLDVCALEGDRTPCIRCLRGLLLTSGENVTGICLLPRAWMTISSGDGFGLMSEMFRLPEILIALLSWPLEIKPICDRISCSALVVCLVVGESGLNVGVVNARGVIPDTGPAIGGV